jgi:nitroreductase
MNQTISADPARNGIFQAMLTRRSVRRFAGLPLEEGMLGQLLAAADAAPSAHGRKPWRFARIGDRDLLEATVARLPWFKPSLEAAAVIMVLGSPADCVQAEYWPVDCAAATQNLLLAARGLGLGSLWMGISPVAANVEAIGSLFRLPEGLVPFSLVAVGQPLAPDAFAPASGKPDRTALVPLPARAQP